MTGKRRSRRGEAEPRRQGDETFVSPSPRHPVTPSPSLSKGFTLLELMIVISIIIILAAVALPQYRRTITAAREAVLRDDLHSMRKLLDQYAADKGKLPSTLADLVNEKYMRELPVDPFTGKPDWTEETGDDPSGGEPGVVNVRSASSDTSSEGNLYSEW